MASSAAMEAAAGQPRLAGPDPKATPTQGEQHPSAARGGCARRTSRNQSRPSCTGRVARGQYQQETDEQQRDVTDDHRCQHRQRYQHQQPEMFGAPATGQCQATAGDDRGDHQSGHRGQPFIDGGDGENDRYRRWQ